MFKLVNMRADPFSFSNSTIQLFTAFTVYVTPVLLSLNLAPFKRELGTGLSLQASRRAGGLDARPDREVFGFCRSLRRGKQPGRVPP
jgi:hypothetical protein